jgi:hypothetical protein
MSIEALQMICAKCRGNEWGPETPRKEILAWFHDFAAAAIEQAERQEPVAWLEPEWGEKICLEVGYEITMTDDHPRDLCWIPLYAHPPQRQPLTDEEIEAAWKVAMFEDNGRHALLDNQPFVHFARAIERKHGIGGRE